MALDTREKRLAVMQWGYGSLPTPDASLSASDREQLLGLTRFSDVVSPGSSVTRRSGMSLGLILGMT